MAVYAALVSLMNNMEQIKNHPRLSTSLDKKQIESLGEKVDFLLDFMESYIYSHGGISKEEAEDLESQIASAAHAAEDVIESHVVDQILARSFEESSVSLLDLQKVIEDMDAIKVKVMEVKEKSGFKEEEQPTCSMPSTSSRPLTTGKTTMVGFDDELIQLMDVLTGQQSSRKIISIVGMGGIGKTTLAKNVYENLVIRQHFDIWAWSTISQKYSVIEILLELLSCLGKPSSGTVEELGEQLHKRLSSRRYLIILDDIWSIEIWEKINFYFPHNCNRSRVVLTTRLSNMAIRCGSSCFRMNFLDEHKSWKLFCEKVFGKGKCPPQLEKIGKEIAKQCKGLPLSIVVIGGLLQKSYRTTGYWQNVAKNINSLLNSGENEQCLNVLSLSYSYLPAHLKPCFLYMGFFDGGHKIHASQLIKLWVAEGFLKPNHAQILEEIAEGYLEDLVDRNLILVVRRGRNGKIKTCQFHDLLRDLCLRIAAKEKFFHVIGALGISRGIDMERRLVFHDSKDHIHTLQSALDLFNALQSTSLARSLMCNMVETPIKSRLLRVLHVYFVFTSFPEAVFQNVNLRYLTYYPRSGRISVLPSSISLFWNLQTLIVRVVSDGLVVAPPELWKMPQLRHLDCDKIYVPEPPTSDEQGNFFALGNLQTLKEVVNFRWSEEACKRIPNIKKLHIKYGDVLEGYDDCLFYDLCNLGCLHILESLSIKFPFRTLPMSIGLLKNAFPSSLNKLSLTNCHLRWDDLTLIGSLPQLEVLKLERNSVVGQKWSPVDGEFLRLKFLKIDECDLRSWTADSSHFPVLEKLVLLRLWSLSEIPSGIGEIPTLELIRLECCCQRAAISAMKIKKEQESLGNVGLQIQVKISICGSIGFSRKVEREGLTIDNIQLELE